MPFDIQAYIWCFFVFFCAFMWYFTVLKPGIQRKKREKKAQALDVVLYGILEHSNAGARTWLTPFDIKSEGAAFAETVKGLERDDDIRFCTIFRSINGGEAEPIFTVGRPDPDTLKPRI